MSSFYELRQRLKLRRMLSISLPTSLNVSLLISASQRFGHRVLHRSEGTGSSNPPSIIAFLSIQAIPDQLHDEEATLGWDKWKKIA